MCVAPPFFRIIAVGKVLILGGRQGGDDGLHDVVHDLTAIYSSLPYFPPHLGLPVDGLQTMLWEVLQFCCDRRATSIFLIIVVAMPFVVVIVIACPSV